MKCDCHGQPMVRNGVRADGKIAWTCRVKRYNSTRAWRAANPERAKALKRRYDATTRARRLRQHKDRRRRYGLSKTDWLALLEASDGLCALCYEEPATLPDHDHATGRVRGALCSGCNTGLGLLGDDVRGLDRAIEYLETTHAVF